MLTPAGVKAWSRIHRWSSLACTAFVLLLCVTGLPLIFADEIDHWRDPVPVASPAAEARPVAIDAIVSAALADHSHDVVRFLSWDDEGGNRVQVGIVPDPEAAPALERILTFDSRTGRLVAEEKPGQGLTNTLLLLHSELFMGLPGMVLLGVMGFLFVLAVLSGIVLYGPFMKRLPFGAMRLSGPRNRAWLDLHNLLGIVLAAWTLVVGLTGIMNTLADPLFDLWQATELPRVLAPYAGRPRPARLASVDRAVEAAQEALPSMKVASVLFPSIRFGSPRHYVIWMHGGTPASARLFTPVLVDAENGSPAQVEALPWYLRLLELARPLHFGDYGGLPLKIAWVLFDLGTIGVLVSGLALWFLRSRPHAARIEDGLAAAKNRQGSTGTTIPKTGTGPRRPRIWAWPAALAGLIALGLCAAMFGQSQAWRVLSWSALAAVIAVTARLLLRSHEEPGP